MSYFSILVLAFALSVDAGAVSFSYGIKYQNERMKNALLLGIYTGVFQGIMPVLGYFAATPVKNYIQPYSKVIIFTIFFYLGIKFISEAFQKDRQKELCISTKCLILIGIATSIDAFSAGITLLLSGNRIFKPALLISFITFVNAYTAFYIGGKIRHKTVKWPEVLAGVLLIMLGIKGLDIL